MTLPSSPLIILYIYYHLSLSLEELQFLLFQATFFLLE